MNNLHSNWENTDEGEQPVPVRVKQASPHAVPQLVQKRQTVNRFPAAVLGIIAIAGIGFFVFDGMNVLLGQTTTNAQDVRISENGLEPDTVKVTAGESIRWINDSSIPHILASDELKNGDGELFETIAIFPGSDYVFNVPAEVPAGTYAYVSRTSPSVNGSIEVTSAQILPAGMQTSSIAAPMMPSSYASSITTTPPTSSSIGTQATVTSVGGIPSNPYAIANTAYTQTNGSTPTSTSGLPAAATVTAHRPVTQPSSGMGLWMAGLAGAAALFIVLKKSAVKQ